MKFKFSLFILCFILINICVCEDDEINYDYNDDEEYYYPNYTNVMTFTDENYTDILKYNKIFVFAYATDNLRSQELMSSYLDTANYLIEEEKSDIKFARIDAVWNHNFSEEYDIAIYPTLFFLLNGKKYYYHGYRTKAGLLKFLDKIFIGAITEIKTLNELDYYVSNNKLVLLSTFKDKSSKLLEPYRNISNIFDKIYFLSCVTKECIDKYNKNDFILFKKFDENVIYYSKNYDDVSKVTNESIYDFVGTFVYENGKILGDEQISLLFSFDKRMIFYFRNSSDESQTKYDKVFKELGDKFRLKHVYTAVCDIVGNRLFEETMEYFVVHKSHLPAVVYYENKHNGLVTYRISNAKPENLSLEFLEKYVNDIQAGKITKDLKSMFPMNQLSIDGIGARIVIGSTYDDMVINEKNNIVLAFVNRMTYCELCDKYLEVFKTLGHKHKNDVDPKVIYAVIDGVGNDARDFEYKYDDLPIILLYTNAMKEKKRIQFKPKNDTDISEEEVVEFVASNLDWDKEYVEKHLAQPDPRIKKENKVNNENSDL